MKKVIEGTYIPLARYLQKALVKREYYTEKVKESKRACASAMQSVKVRSFDFRSDDGHLFNASLERPKAERIHKRRLYVLLASGEITLDEFLDCITASHKAVSETLGEEIANELLETYEKGLDLVIRPKKG